MHASGDWRRQLRWLMTLRVVTVTTLLICAFAVELLFRPAETLRPLFTLAAVAYGMVLLYAVLDRWLHGHADLRLSSSSSATPWSITDLRRDHRRHRQPDVVPLPAADLGGRRCCSTAAADWRWPGSAGCSTRRWSPLGSRLVVRSAGHGLAPTREPGSTVYFLVAHLVAMVAVALLVVLSVGAAARPGARAGRAPRGAWPGCKALNENIIESINSGLITTDLAGQINFINRGGTEITGAGRRTMSTGRSVGIAVRAGARVPAGDPQAAAGQPPVPLRAGSSTRRTARRIFLGIAASNLHDKAGQPLGFIFIFQDLTEIHALEQEVRLKERMAALGEMAAGMAHELRNPLAAISGAVQYLQGRPRARGRDARS